MMKKYILILLGLSLLASCGKSETKKADNERVPAIIQVGIVTAPPISKIDPHTLKATGLAIDLLNRVAERAKIKVNYVPTDWSNMAAALAGGRVQMVAGPVFQTEARAVEFLFTKPIWEYAIVAVKRKNDDRLKTYEDLISKKVDIAVGRGGFDAEFATRVMKNANVIALPPEQPDASMLEILSGRTEIALVDMATAIRFLRRHPQLTLLEGGRPISLQLAGFMVRRDMRKLKDFLDIAIANLAASGELRALASKYNGKGAYYSMPPVDQYNERPR